MDVEPYEMLFDYSHTQGAVIFVKVRKPMGPGNRGAADPSGNRGHRGNSNASGKKRKATAAAGKQAAHRKNAHLNAKEDSGMSASREQFKGHFLCMFILRYTLT